MFIPDGACKRNPGPAGLGAVFKVANQTYELSEYIGEGTNNIAELMAIQRALEADIAPELPMVICTDSSYSIGVLSKGWKAKANKELIAEIKSLLREKKNVEFVHVRGHQGNPLNERADELAVQATESKRSTEWVPVHESMGAH